MTVWLLIAILQGYNGSPAIGQIGPFATEKECQTVATILKRRVQAITLCIEKTALKVQ